MNERHLSWEELITGYMLLFQRTGNPLFAWSAYFRCRSAGREIPDWVLECLDRAAYNLMGLCHSPPDKGKIAPAVMESLEMKAPGKSGAINYFKEVSAVRSDFEMAASAFSYFKDGYNLTDAAKKAKDDHGVGKSTVDRAVKKYLPDLGSFAKKEFEFLHDRSNLDMALDVASYIEDEHKRGLLIEPIELLVGMAVEYVAGKYNVEKLTVARAFAKYFPKKEYWGKLSNSK